MVPAVSKTGTGGLDSGSSDVVASAKVSLLLSLMSGDFDADADDDDDSGSLEDFSAVELRLTGFDI